MNAVAVIRNDHPAFASCNILPLQGFSEDLFGAFVKWVDRSAKTTRSYLTNLKQFAAWMRYSQVQDPLREDVIAYREWLCSDHDAIALDSGSDSGWCYRLTPAGERMTVVCKPTTIAQYLRSVCQFFRWTSDEGLYPNIAANIHAPKIRTDTHKKDALKLEEVREIESSIAVQNAQKVLEAQEAEKDAAGRIQRSTEQGKRLYAMYLLAVNAGLRTVEISRANVKDFVTKGAKSWLYVWGKGHKEADTRKYLAPEVADAVREYMKSRTDRPTGASPLFVATGNRSGGKRIAPTTISAMLKKAMQAAGYDSERITAHSLRHSAGTAVMDLTGGNLYETQRYMRHTDPKTTEIYIHETEKAEAKAEALAQRLYNAYHGTETDSRAQLESVIDRLTQEQIEKLAAFASAMV